jgi:hypothetical protein
MEHRPSQHRPQPELPEPQKKSGVSKLLEEAGLFTADIPRFSSRFIWKDPTCFPLEVMNKLQYDLTITLASSSPGSSRAKKLASWKESIGKIQMAYEIIVYPLLKRAESQLASNPERVPREYGPADYESTITEKIRDAQEHPHRASVQLNDEELKILSKLTQARGLPFDPDKHVYHYTECSGHLNERSHGEEVRGNC